MTALDPALESVFSQAEQALDREVSMFQLMGGVNEVARKSYEWETVPQSFRSEHFVLNLSGRMRVQEEGWGEYFGPTLGPVEYTVTEEDLTYWMERAEESVHPQLRARYSDAVWDLTAPALGTKPPFASARIATEAYIDAAEQIQGAQLERRLDWLDRALYLSISTNNVKQRERCVDAHLTVASKTDSLRAWFRAHATVFRVRKVKPTDEQKTRVLEGLERHAENELAADSVLPFQAHRVRPQGRSH